MIELLNWVSQDTKHFLGTIIAVTGRRYMVSRDRQSMEEIMADKPLFSLIETSAKLPDGRTITGYYSNPKGYTKAEYDEMYASLVKAFGSVGSVTKGTRLGD